ncbi:glycosyltransferase [Leptospira barantonii]|uniref:Glycosyltransferase n=1 Tax=Leptospira barantonii TaxID=2023184 RepID=A0A5F2B0X2_9LEPT|nr:glycosyltransferase family 2 protein [Leptospira barantonii]TGL98128.1 glycosyltransferase [Leptospira barantonii]
MKNKVISIVTINYNDKVGLERTLLSVRDQDDSGQIEHIIIDAGSNDGSFDVIQKYSDGISFWASEPDRGIYDGQNKGIRNSTCNYILFLNSGDVLANKNTISEILSYKLDADLVYGNMLIESQNTIKVRLGKQPTKMTLNHLLRDTIWHPACLIRRDLFEKFGLYDLSFKIAADYEFWLKIFSAGVSSKHIPVTFSKFNMEGLSSDPKNRFRIITERKQAQSRYFSRITLLLHRDIPGFFWSLQLLAKRTLYRILVFAKLKSA